MAEMNKKERADETYQTMFKALNKRNWNYQESSGERMVHFSVSGEDLPMDFVIRVDEERQLVRLYSKLPFSVPEDKRTEFAVASVIVTNGLIVGNFDFDLSSGECWFRMTESYMDRTVGDGLFQYMISLSCMIVEQYNDKLFMVSKGMMQAAEMLNL